MCDCVDKATVKKILEAMGETIKKQQREIDELNRRLRKLEEPRERNNLESVLYNYNWDNESRNG